MASVKHATSVQGADDPGKSVQAAQWNEDHTLTNVADQTSLDAVSAAVSVVAANLSTLSILVSSLSGGGEVHPTSDEWSVLTDRVGTLSGQESALSVLHSALSVQVTNVSGAISTLSLAVSVVEANRNALSQQTSALSVLHSALSVQVTNVSGAISVLSLAVSVVEANRNALSQQVSTLSVQASALSVLHSALSVQVTNVSGAISTLSLAVSVVEANRNTLSTQVSALSVLHSALSVQVTNVSGAISTLSLAVSAVAANLSALSILESALSIQVSTISAQMTSLAAQKVVTLAEQTISVSALTNVSGMSFSVGANNTYAFKYMIIYQMASTTSGLGVSVTFPGMKTFGAQAEIPSAATGTGQIFCGAITASGTKIQALSCQTAATDFYAEVKGIFTVSTTGTLQLQANAGVGGTSAQAIIRAGTAGAIWRMA